MRAGHAAAAIDGAARGLAAFELATVVAGDARLDFVPMLRGKRFPLGRSFGPGHGMRASHRYREGGNRHPRDRAQTTHTEELPTRARPAIPTRRVDVRSHAAQA